MFVKTNPFGQILGLRKGVVVILVYYTKGFGADIYRCWFPSSVAHYILELMACPGFNSSSCLSGCIERLPADTGLADKVIIRLTKTNAINAKYLVLKILVDVFSMVHCIVL